MKPNQTNSCPRPLYPVRVLSDTDVIRSSEIVRFGGVPFVQTTSGEWAMLDAAACD